MRTIKKILTIIEFYLGGLMNPSSKQGKENRALIYSNKEKFLKSKGL